MLTMMRSKTGISDVSDVGISIPHWNMYWSSPVVFRHTDLPPALGPEIKRICLAGVRRMETGTMVFFSLPRALSRSGWRALRRFISPLSEMIGIPALKSRATCALATRKSISPMYLAELTRSGTYGLTKSLKAARMRCIS